MRLTNSANASELSIVPVPLPPAPVYVFNACFSSFAIPI